MGLSLVGNKEKMGEESLLHVCVGEVNPAVHLLNRP